MSQPTPQRPPHPPARASRTGAVVAGALLALVAFGLLAVGGVALWGDSRKDADGYLSTSSHPFVADGRALVTDDLDVDLDGLGAVGTGDAGKVRLQVRPRSDEPVFVGIAPTRDAARYLRGTQHSVVTDVELSPFHADYAPAAGTRKPADPSAQGFWAAASEGSGTRTLEWSVEEGSWSVVVMNADASPGVAAGVSAGAELPFLAAVGWGGLGGGVALMAGAAALLAFGLRTPRPRAEAPGAAVPAAPQVLA
jgi:hypothetical protein